MGLLLLLLIGIAAGGYLVLFSLSNTQQVSLDLLGGWYLHDAAQWHVVAVCIAIGMLAAILLLLPSQMGWRATARRYQRELRRAQALLDEGHRNLATPMSPSESQTEEAAAGEEERAAEEASAETDDEDVSGESDEAEAASREER